MDLFMPIMSGYEATAVLRQHTHELPIVAVTANAQPQDRAACEAAGMNGFVTKPYRKKEVYEVLSKYVGDRFS
jgi:CheY-like chemotaxis protein